VPRALDIAIRRCLERDPSLRYASALEMASALEGGLRDEEPHTAAFATGSTQMLGDDATQALPRTSALPSRQETYAPPAAPARRERVPERRPKRDSAARARLFALALILLLGAVAIALLISGGGGSGFTNIDEGNARDQAIELMDYVREHRK
jgi:hypothetical protein